MFEQSIKNRSMRLIHKVRVEVQNSHGQKSIFDTRDFSDTGVFIVCGQHETPSLGSLVKIHALDIEGAQAQSARVIRIDSGRGFAAKFLEE